MLIYIAFFAINMFVGQFIMHVKSKDYEKKKNKKVYLLFTTLQYGLLLGFRSSSMTYDTGAYEIVFNRIHGGWDYLFSNSSSWIENGYYMLCVIVKTLGGDFRTLLIITSLFIVGSTSLFVYRHSQDVIFSVFLLICFPYYYTSFDILRHYLSIAFFLLGYKYVEERRLFKYLVFIIIGAQFHVFAYLLIPVYWLYKLKWNKLSVPIYMIFTGISYIFIEKLSNLITMIIGKSVENYSYWVGGAAGGYRTAIMYALMAALVIIAYRNTQEKYERNDLAVNATMILFACAIVYTNARIIIRLLVAMIPLVAISYPDLLCSDNSINIVNARLTKAGIIIIGLSYHIYMMIVNWQNIVPYIPYWR